MNTDSGIDVNNSLPPNRDEMYELGNEGLKEIEEIVASFCARSSVYSAASRNPTNSSPGRPEYSASMVDLESMRIKLENQFSLEIEMWKELLGGQINNKLKLIVAEVQTALRTQTSDNEKWKIDVEEKINKIAQNEYQILKEVSGKLFTLVNTQLTDVLHAQLAGHSDVISALAHQLRAERSRRLKLEKSVGLLMKHVGLSLGTEEESKLTHRSQENQRQKVSSCASNGGRSPAPLIDLDSGIQIGTADEVTLAGTHCETAASVLPSASLDGDSFVVTSVQSKPMDNGVEANLVAPKVHEEDSNMDSYGLIKCRCRAVFASKDELYQHLIEMQKSKLPTNKPDVPIMRKSQALIGDSTIARRSRTGRPGSFYVHQLLENAQRVLKNGFDNRQHKRVGMAIDPNWVSNRSGPPRLRHFCKCGASYSTKYILEAHLQKMMPEFDVSDGGGGGTNAASSLLPEKQIDTEQPSNLSKEHEQKQRRSARQLNKM